MEDCIDLISRSVCLGSRQRSVVCASVIGCTGCVLRGWLQVSILYHTLATPGRMVPHGIAYLSLQVCHGLLWTGPKHAQVSEQWLGDALQPLSYTGRTWSKRLKKGRMDSTLIILEPFKISQTLNELHLQCSAAEFKQKLRVALRGGLFVCCVKI